MGLLLNQSIELSTGTIITNPYVHIRYRNCDKNKVDYTVHFFNSYEDRVNNKNPIVELEQSFFTEVDLDQPECSQLYIMLKKESGFENATNY